MKRYVFALAKVLRVRRIEEEQAAARLAAARSAAAAAQGRESAATQALASRCARGGLQPAASFLAWAETTMLAGEALSTAKAEKQAADDDVEARREEWSSAATRVAALERLDERGRQEHGVARRREEARNVDDIVTGRSRPRRPGPAEAPGPNHREGRP